MKRQRLTVARSTLRHLATAELRAPAGGDAAPMTIRSFDYQCPASAWDVNCKPSGIDVCPM